jgi:hypothetical protein
MPYENPDELVAVDWRTHASEQYPLSVPDFLDYQKQNRSFTQMAAYLSRITTWWALAIPNVSKAKWFRRNSFLFSMLSQSLAGHFFPKRDKLGAAPVSVIGDELWKRKFDSSPSVLGTVLI